MVPVRPELMTGKIVNSAKNINYNVLMYNILYIEFIIIIQQSFGYLCIDNGVYRQSV